MRDGKTTFCYPSSCRHVDGHIYMGMSWYDEKGHASGAAIVVPDDPDYDLWLWILPRLSSENHRQVSDQDRERFRTELEQARSQAISNASFRAQLLAEVPVCPEPTKIQRMMRIINSGVEQVLAFTILGLGLLIGGSCHLGMKLCRLPSRAWKHLWERFRKTH